ncbi:hypothetical protein BGX24_002694 [Mortierella sp. AD032]|nr:hypothetical protein BGX24_002694 [Mortierella sp. AD032]
MYLSIASVIFATSIVATATAGGPNSCTQSGCFPTPKQACVWAFWGKDCEKQNVVIREDYGACVNLDNYGVAYHIASIGDIQAEAGLTLYSGKDCKGERVHFNGFDHFRDLGYWNDHAGSLKFTNPDA